MKRILWGEIAPAVAPCLVETQARCCEGSSRLRHPVHLLLPCRPLVGKKKPPPRAGVWGLLITPGSLGVRNVALGQCRLGGSARHFLLVVLLAVMSQGHLWFLRNPGPRSLAWWSAPHISEVNTVGSGCYRSFV